MQYFATRYAGPKALAIAIVAIAIPELLSTATANAGAHLKIAIVGDQGVNRDSRAVLQMIADEGTDLVLIQGDFAYDDTRANTWISNIDEILGELFPVLITVGNHDRLQWPIYRQWQEKRLSDLPDLQCNGKPGVMAHCTYQGVSVVQIAPGIREAEGISPKDDYAAYLDDALSNDDNVWRFCSWHKLQADMQVGSKPDEAGWDVYNTCLRHGGIVITGHEHSYSRTFLMRDFQRHDVVHQGNLLEVKSGQSFAVVSGLGGYGIRDQENFDDWWASVYSSTQDADHGALFCTLNGADAECYFKDVSGTVPDQFSIVNENTVASSATSTTDDVAAEFPPAIQSESVFASSTGSALADTTTDELGSAELKTAAGIATGSLSLLYMAVVSLILLFKRPFVQIRY